MQSILCNERNKLQTKIPQLWRRVKPGLSRGLPSRSRNPLFGEQGHCSFGQHVEVIAPNGCTTLEWGMAKGGWGGDDDQPRGSAPRRHRSDAPLLQPGDKVIHKGPLFIVGARTLGPLRGGSCQQRRQTADACVPVKRGGGSIVLCVAESEESLRWG